MRREDQRGETSEPYRRFAAAYASGEERRFSEEMACFALNRASELLDEPVGSVLDVACGIGAACEYFAGSGLRTFGVDASDEMLDQARAAARAKSVNVRYSRQDMREISLTDRVDLVTCMYDSLNFMLTDEDLITAFESARSALRRGGVYVFDLYTPAGLEAHWGTRDEVHTANAQHFVATRTVWNPDTRTNTKSFWGFDRDGDTWGSWSEKHTVRAYTVAQIRHAVKATGFNVRELYQWNRDRAAALTPGATRVVVVGQNDVTPVTARPSGGRLPTQTRRWMSSGQ